MSNAKKKVYDFLRGSFLTDESALKNWRIIIFVVVLLLIMITSAHRIDKKVIKISDLNEELRELTAEYKDVQTLVTKMELESSVRSAVIERGLKPLENPPKKIKVTIKK